MASSPNSSCRISSAEPCGRLLCETLGVELFLRDGDLVIVDSGTESSAAPDADAALAPVMGFLRHVCRNLLGSFRDVQRWDQTDDLSFRVEVMVAESDQANVQQTRQDRRQLACLKRWCRESIVNDVRVGPGVKVHWHPTIADVRQLREKPVKRRWLPVILFIATGHALVSGLEKAWGRRTFQFTAIRCFRSKIVPGDILR